MCLSSIYSKVGENETSNKYSLGVKKIKNNGNITAGSKRCVIRHQQLLKFSLISVDFLHIIVGKITQKGANIQYSISTKVCGIQDDQDYLEKNVYTPNVVF